MEKPEILSTLETARLLGLSPAKVTTAIRKGDLPVGFVVDPTPGKNEHIRTVIIKKRLERWLNGEDLQGINSPDNLEKWREATP